LAWPTHINANIVPIVSKPFFIVFASDAVWSTSWMIPKISLNKQPISRNDVADQLFGVIYHEFEVSIRTIENGESKSTEAPTKSRNS
jgi:hypothetical protein